MVRKEFVRPELEIVKLKDVDILTSSGGTGGTIPDAPFGVRQSDDWEFYDED